ncbi:MAG TPA: LysM peptidoglycan-binding domain-containing protein [Streptosporangiaceae bacterium]|nr:LysM peptidoglycan-binding domain-containing protein [Streptosporangiaceae bacterium]
MAGFPPIAVRQPAPYDIVDDPVRASGIGTGFEGQFAACVLDGNGNQIAEASIHAGGMAILGNYDRVAIPITFGSALLNPYRGFAQYTVVGGDTLSGIAQRYYGDAGKWPVIYEANRYQIQNPDRIFAGQVLRIPQ